MIEPGFSASLRPPAPRTISSTSRDPVTQRKTIVERAATSPIVDTSTAPRAARSSAGLRFLRPRNVRANPLSTMFLAIPWPIRPIPIKPIRSSVALVMPLSSVSADHATPRSTEEHVRRGPEILGATADLAPALSPYIFAPIVLLAKAEHMLRLAVGQKRFIFAEFALQRNVGIEALDKFPRRQIGGAVVIGGVEHLVAEPVLLDGKVGDLAEVARIDVAPGDPLAEAGIGEPFRRTARIRAAR